MLERDVEKYLCNEVKKAGGLCWKFTSPGLAGVPDRIVVLPDNNVWFVEVKADNGKLTKLQQSRLSQLDNRQARTAVVYGKDDVDAFLGYWSVVNTRV